jgi:type IV pilus assembly protein PilQ
VSKVPVLGDIPGLGYLFRSRERINDNAELLIFVTPRILREGTRVN